MSVYVRRSSVCLLLLSVSFLSLSIPTAGGAEETSTEVLGADTIWRFHMTYRRDYGERQRAAEPVKFRWVRWGEQLAGPLPETDWYQRLFDDSGWPRRKGPFLGGYGATKRPGAALICLRGKFGVSSPSEVEGLRLQIRYRGGVVVYLNGVELARAHMPAGEIQPLTHAEAYRRQAFVTSDGTMLRDYGRREPPEDVRDRLDARIRRYAVEIPPKLLRKGTNVLALGFHRAPLPDDLPDLSRLNWDTVGMCGVELTADSSRTVRPNIAGPEKFHVWTADPMLRVGFDADYGDPFDSQMDIKLVAPRNGFASGQAVINSPLPCKQLSARMTDLESPSGSVIAASNVRLRFADVFRQSWPEAGRSHQDDPEPSFVPLLEEPLGSARLQPVWLTVHVPPDAAPGSYKANLHIETNTGTAAVPVELMVYNWQVADPKDWRTWVNLMQSPESVAGYYGVPLWSDRHFDLMARSFKLMAEAGNDLLGISAVGRNVFGDDPLIVFREQDGRLVPEFKFLDRYLKLYDEIAGPPTFLSLQVWSYGMYQRGAGRDGGKVEKRAETIPVVQLRNDELAGIEIPIYGEPGTEQLWAAVMDGLARRVEALGWGKDCILLGTSGDAWPSPITVSFFKKIAPYARWRAITHGSGAPQWGGTPAERTQPNGMVVGCLELARRITNMREKVELCPVACNARDCVRINPFGYRSLPGTNTISANFDGICWKGLDYWQYTLPTRETRKALNTYVHFGNIVGGDPRTMAAPGPNGPVATVQFEMLRQGLQETEAMLFIRRALHDEKTRRAIDDDLVRRCEEAMERLLCLLETGLRYSPQGGGDVHRHVEHLYEVTAELAAAIETK